MRTQSTLIREYANGVADGFLNDLILASERKQLKPVIDSENALIDAFRNYVHDPETLWTKRKTQNHSYVACRWDHFD